MDLAFSMGPTETGQLNRLSLVEKPSISKIMNKQNHNLAIETKSNYHFALAFALKVKINRDQQSSAFSMQ